MGRRNIERRFQSGRGGRGGLRGDRSKGVFYKLLKDESATMRSRNDALRFIVGMESFESKAELLGLLDDNRYSGPVSFMEGFHENMFKSIAMATFESEMHNFC